MIFFVKGNRNFEKLFKYLLFLLFTVAFFYSCNGIENCFKDLDLNKCDKIDLEQMIYHHYDKFHGCKNSSVKSSYLFQYWNYEKNGIDNPVSFQFSNDLLTRYYNNVEKSYYFYSMSHVDSAHIFIQKSLKISTNNKFNELLNLDAYYLNSWLKYLQRDYTSALIYINKILSLIKNDSKFNKNFNAKVLGMKARYLQRDGHKEKALTLLEISKDMVVNKCSQVYAELLEFEANNLLKSNQKFAEDRKFQDIIKSLQRCSILGFRGLRLKGLKSYRQKQYQDAIFFYNQFLHACSQSNCHIDPQYYDESYYILSKSYDILEKVNQADSIVQISISRRPDLFSSAKQSINSITTNYDHAKASMLIRAANTKLTKFKKFSIHTDLILFWNFINQADSILSNNLAVVDYRTQINQNEILRDLSNSALDALHYIKDPVNQEIYNRLSYFFDRSKNNFLYAISNKHVDELFIDSIKKVEAHILSLSEEIYNDRNVNILLYEDLLDRKNRLDQEFETILANKYNNLKVDSPLFFIDELLIQTFIQGDNLFFLKQKQNKINFSKISIEGLTDSLNKLLDILSGPQNNTEDQISMAKFIYKNVWLKILDQDSVFGEIHMINDGSLTYVPFEYLKFISEGSLKTEEVIIPIYRYNSLKQFTDYDFDKIENPKSISLISFTDQNTISKNTQPYPELIGSQKEKELYSLLNYKIKSISGEKILIDTVLQFLQFDSDIIHISLHGIYDLKNYQNSALICRDGNLNFHNLFALNKKNYLTVLSSCGSGIGRNFVGEGIFSLRRIFEVIGSKNVLSTTWNISDYSAPIIFQNFYKHLSKGNSIEKALILAKKDFLNNADYETVKPFYWLGYLTFRN